MDLALEMGMPVETLKCVMTERELGMWRHYASKKLLPARRSELYLAQIAQAMSGGPLSNYLLRSPADVRSDEIADAVSEIAPLAGVRRLGQKKVH